MDAKSHIRALYKKGQRTFVESDLEAVNYPFQGPKERLAALLALHTEGFLTLRLEATCGSGHPVWGGTTNPPATQDLGPCPTCGQPSRYRNYEFFLAPVSSSTSPATDASLAERLYCAYNRGGDPSTAGLNYQGKECPAWSDLPENIRAKWEAVTAEAAARRIVDAMPANSQEVFDRMMSAAEPLVLHTLAKPEPVWDTCASSENPGPGWEPFGVHPRIEQNGDTIILWRRLEK